jgi:hypothetical protein
MDAMSSDALEPVEIMPANGAEPVTEQQSGRRRESGYCRIKRRALIAEAKLADQKAIADEQKARADLSAGDVTALERIVDRLLNHLDRAARTDMTDQDRNRYRQMVADIRGHLANKE